MIKSVTLMNIMGIGNPGVQLNFSEKLNVLYGDNGTGKSSIWTGVLTALGGSTERKNEYILKDETDFGFSEVIIDNIVDRRELIEHPLTTGKKEVTFRVEFHRTFDKDLNETIKRFHWVNNEKIGIQKVRDILAKIDFDPDDRATFIAAGQTKTILESTPRTLLRHFEKILKLGSLRKKWLKDLSRIENTNQKIEDINYNLQQTELKLEELSLKQRDYEKKTQLVNEKEQVTLNREKAHLRAKINQSGVLEDEIFELNEFLSEKKENRKKLDQKHKKLTKKRDSIRIDLSDKTSKRETIERKINAFNQKLGGMKRDLNILKSAYNLSKNIPNHLDITDARNRYSELKNDQFKHKTNLEQINEQIVSLKEKVCYMKEGIPLDDTSRETQISLENKGISAKPLYELIKFQEDTSENEKKVVEALLGDIRNALVVEESIYPLKKDIERILEKTNFKDHLMSTFDINERFSKSNNFKEDPFLKSKYNGLAESLNLRRNYGEILKKNEDELIKRGFILDEIGLRYLFSEKNIPLIDKNKRLDQLEKELNEKKGEKNNFVAIGNNINNEINQYSQFESLFLSWNSKREILDKAEEIKDQKRKVKENIEEQSENKLEIQSNIDVLTRMLEDKNDKCGELKGQISNLQNEIEEKEERVKGVSNTLTTITRVITDLEKELNIVNREDLSSLEDPEFYNQRLKAIDADLNAVKDSEDYSDMIVRLEDEKQKLKVALRRCRKENQTWEQKIQNYIRDYQRDLKNNLKSLNSRFKELLSYIETDGNVKLVGKADLENDTLGIDLYVKFKDHTKYHSALGETLLSGGEKAAILIAFIVSVQETFLTNAFCFWDEIYDKTDPIRTEKLMKILGESSLTYIIISPKKIYLKPASIVYLLRHKQNGINRFQKIPEEIFKTDISSTELPYFLEKRDIDLD